MDSWVFFEVYLYYLPMANGELSPQGRMKAFKLFAQNTLPSRRNCICMDHNNNELFFD